ncbi:hypothetical protein C8R48DRAFT_702456 [Suillus tomentosus]|nr:hypothetical protein C8R48DRAFT_702456 [Suillus tomentosus]
MCFLKIFTSNSLERRHVRKSLSLACITAAYLLRVAVCRGRSARRRLSQRWRASHHAFSTTLVVFTLFAVIQLARDDSEGRVCRCKFL